MPRHANYIGPKKTVESVLPKLQIGLYHTTSSAIHNLYFEGDLQPWLGFLSAARTAY